VFFIHSDPFETVLITCYRYKNAVGQYITHSTIGQENDGKNDYQKCLKKNAGIQFLAVSSLANADPVPI